MSEPVIPIFEFINKNLKDWRPVANRIFAAEAKVAEQEAANEFAKTKYSAYRDEATAEYARYELMLAEQAATIERLTDIDLLWDSFSQVLETIDQGQVQEESVMRYRDFRKCLDAAMSKQEPKS